jgi:hypothetical protein
MSSEDGDVYIMREGEDGEWVSPRPALEVITEAIADSTDMDEGEIEDLESHVDTAALRGVLNGDDGEVSFEFEDLEVTVDGAGEVAVE